MFDKLLKTLNTQQRLAVETIEGPVMLLAGPGSGKTYTLTTRIANILLETDTHPSNILALTFTDNAASNMRIKLSRIIGNDAYKVRIMTFHSFCNDVIQKYPENFGFSLASRQITDLEKIRLIEDMIDDLDLEYLTTFSSPYLYKNDIIKSISDLKREGFNTKEFQKLISEEEDELNEIDKINPKTKKPYGKWLKKEKEINKNKELAKLYEKYQEILEERELYDYDDMILLVTEKFEQDTQLLADFQEQFLYILVDEFQDTNGAQSRILELLGSFDERPNIFVVGDDDQAIYRFQGANIENMFEFIQEFPQTQIITLNETYRCPQPILNGARDIVNQNENTLEKKVKGINKNLLSNNHLKNKIKIQEFATTENELIWVKNEVKALIDQGTNPDQIAILYRSHKDAEELKRLFMKDEIKCNIQDRKDVMEDEYVRKFLNILELIEGFEDNELLYKVLNYDFAAINRLDLFKIVENAKLNNKTIWETLQKVDALDIESQDKINEFIDIIVELHAEQYNLNLIELLERALHKTGILDYLREAKNYESIDALITIFKFFQNSASSKKDYGLKELLDDINSLEVNRLSVTMDYTEVQEGVHFMTVHKAKGLEFDYVFIIKVNDKKWGNSRAHGKIKLPSGVLDTIDIDKQDKNEEERRLLYVGITRAVKELHLTYANRHIEDGKERSLLPSQFIEEIATKHKEKFDHTEEEFDESIILEEVQPLELDDRESIYIKSKIENFRLSVTALNRYIESPREFLFDYLIRLPKVKTKELILGSTIHKIMEHINRRINQEIEIKEVEYYKQMINNLLNLEILTEDEYNDIESEAHKMIDSYLPTLDASSKIAEVEYNFSGKSVMLDDTPLTGKIDNIEWVDKSKREVKIIDYKTSKPKTRNQILGNTKYSNKNLLRQLQFYKLLIELDDKFDLIPVEFEIRFLRQDAKKRYKTESFSRDEIQTEELRETIRLVMENIRNLNFNEPLDSIER